jgi:hypothetical protein
MPQMPLPAGTSRNLNHATEPGGARALGQERRKVGEIEALEARLARNWWR